MRRGNHASAIDMHQHMQACTTSSRGRGEYHEHICQLLDVAIMLHPATCTNMGRDPHSDIKLYMSHAPEQAQVQSSHCVSSTCMIQSEHEFTRVYCRSATWRLTAIFAHGRQNALTMQMTRETIGFWLACGGEVQARATPPCWRSLLDSLSGGPCTRARGS